VISETGLISGIFINRSVNEIDININVKAFNEREWMHVNAPIVENYDLSILLAAKFSVSVSQRNARYKTPCVSQVFSISSDDAYVASSLFATGLL
jgi:hypothetical protein